MSPQIRAISLFFHIVATIIWIGGLVLTVIMVWPEVNRALKESPALHTVLSRLRKRFAPLSNLSLAVLLVTGLFQMTADANYNGFLNFDNDWSKIILAKHVLLVGMVLSGALLQYGVAPALERASLLAERGKGDPDEWARLRRREVRLTWFNVILGIIVIALSTWATSL